MRRIINFGAALALACIVPAAMPAAADTSSCTHHWLGPQVCIRMEGRNGWNSVTTIWTNPPKSGMKRTVWLIQDGSRVGSKKTVRRKGKALSYTWSSFQQGTDVKMCVHFNGISRVACDKTKYIGDRESW
ncbi:hypothetical protein OH738_40195 (plasmid) [Streptomyces hirsutus]|uniref:hypothetical protein n=1 Tax=Streptomyces hirsutus TaxID=35620 RepID=UPI002F916CBD|nr:hypothetical protein OH738_40195 [Streptomyces hirsutus]